MSHKKKKRIVEIVRESFDAPIDYHETTSRKRIYVYPRKAMYMLIREFASYSLLEVAKYFGKNDHTTILHHITDGTHMLEYDDNFRVSYEKAREIVKEL